jgi:hypothetical protein
MVREKITLMNYLIPQTHIFYLIHQNVSYAADVSGLVLRFKVPLLYPLLAGVSIQLSMLDRMKIS